MLRRFKIILLLIAFILILGVIGLWALPRAVEALPGQYRVYLPEALLALVTTPLPTALPAPAVAVVQPRITIPALVPPTAAPSATATITPQPTATGNTGAAETAVTPTQVQPSATPTVTETPTLSPTATPEPPPPAARIEGLKVIPQKFNNCGPTNLTMVLNFYGFDVSQLGVAAVVRPNYEDRNVSPWELRDYVNEQTPFRATLHSGGDLTLIKRLVAAGFPVILEKGYIPDETQGWMGHYLTIFGYDDAAGHFYSMDSFLGPWDSSGHVDEYTGVAEQWQHFNNTFIVVYSADREPIVQGILGPELLEPAAMWQTAGLKAQAALEHNPENAFAWFALGDSLTRLGEITGDVTFYQNAAAAFDQARAIGLPPRMLWYQFTPYAAYLAVGRTDDVLTLADATLANQGGRNVEETYLYQGHALLALGDVDGATAAYQRAIQLNQNFSAAQQALDSIGPNAK